MIADGLATIVRTGRLPSPPRVALRVLELCEDPEVAIADITRVIGQDPALAARVLRVANSPLYGAAGKVGSLERAAVHLGLTPLRLLVLTFSLVDRCTGGPGAPFDYDGYWRRAALTAAVAKTLADRFPDPEAADFHDYPFLGGLLADIGMLAFAECTPDRYAKVWSLVSRGELSVQAVEREVFDTDHAELGAYLLGHWKLPAPLSLAIWYHHRPDAIPASHKVLLPLVRCLHVADALAWFVLDDAGPAASRVADLATACFGLDGEGTRALVDDVIDEAARLTDALPIRGVGLLEVDRIRARARELLLSAAWAAPGETKRQTAG